MAETGEAGGVSVKLSVDARQFRAGMRAAKQDTDAFNESLNMAAKGTAQLKAGGGQSATKSSAAQNLGVDVSLNVTDTQLRSLRARVQNALRNIPVSVVPEMRGGGGGSALAGAAVAVAAQTGMTQQQATQAVTRTGSRVFNIPPQGSPWPARAMGGPVAANRGYIVGELRPEVFVPKTPGIIEPSVQDFYRKQEMRRREELRMAVIEDTTQRLHEARMGAIARARFGRRVAPLPPGQPLPPLMGESPLRKGYVRAYHMTPSKENLDSIRQHGLRLSSAKGEEYGEPNQIWFSNRMDDYGASKGYGVEAHLPARWFDYSARHRWSDPPTTGGPNSNMAVGRDISRRRIATYNEPWMHSYRHFMDEVGRAGGTAHPGPRTPGSIMREMGSTMRSLRERYAATGRYEGEVKGYDQFVADSWRSRVRKAGAGARAYRWTMEHGGGTFPVDPTTPIPTRGHALGISEYLPEAESYHVPTGDPRGFLRAFHAQKKAGTPFVGTWIDPDTGKIDVDPSTVVRRKREADMVLRGGHEKAAYDIGKGDVWYASDKQLRANAARLRRIIGLKMMGGDVMAAQTGRLVYPRKNVQAYGHDVDAKLIRQMMGTFDYATEQAANDPVTAFGGNIWYKARRRFLLEKAKEEGTLDFTDFGSLRRSADRVLHSAALASPGLPDKTVAKWMEGMIAGPLTMQYPSGDFVHPNPKKGATYDPFGLEASLRRIQKATGLSPGRGYANLIKAAEVLLKEDPRYGNSPKVGEFYPGLRGRERALVADSHHIDIAGGSWVGGPQFFGSRSHMGDRLATWMEPTKKFPQGRPTMERAAMLIAGDRVQQKYQDVFPTRSRWQAGDWTWHFPLALGGGAPTEDALTDLIVPKGWRNRLPPGYRLGPKGLLLPKMLGGPARAAGGLMARMAPKLPVFDKALEARALEMFGETWDPMRAGYLTPSGKYLDFSRRGTGGTFQRTKDLGFDIGGVRSIPHQAAGALFGAGLRMEDVYERMLDAGYFRIAGFSDYGLEGHMSSPLTGSQMRRLAEDFQYVNASNLMLDIDSRGPLPLLKGTLRKFGIDSEKVPPLLELANKIAGMDPDRLPPTGGPWTRRAGGGRASGKLEGVYLVGEIGKELFVPDHLAHLIPKKVMDQIPKAKGGMQVIGTRRDHDLGGELFFPPSDGVIVPNRLMDQVPRAADGATGKVRPPELILQSYQEGGKFGKQTRFGAGDTLPVNVMNWADARGVFGSGGTGPPRGASAMPPSAGATTATPPPSAFPPDDLTAPRDAHVKAYRSLESHFKKMQAPADAHVQYYRDMEAWNKTQRVAASTATPPQVTGLSEDREMMFEDLERQLSIAGQATTTRTPQGQVAVLASTFLGGGKGRDFERLASQRRALRELRQVEAGLNPDDLRQYREALDDVAATRGDEQKKAQATVDALEASNNKLDEWRQAQENYASTASAGLPGIKEGFANLGKVVVGIQAYQMILQGLSFGMSAARPVVADLVDEIRGFASIGDQTTTRLAQQNKQAQGNLEALFNQQAIQSMAGGPLAELVQQNLALETAVKTGAQNMGEIEDYLKAVQDQNGGVVPAGTFGGYGGPLFESAFMGQAGFWQQFTAAFNRSGGERPDFSESYIGAALGADVTKEDLLGFLEGQTGFDGLAAQLLGGADPAERLRNEPGLAEAYAKATGIEPEEATFDFGRTPGEEELFKALADYAAETVDRGSQNQLLPEESRAPDVAFVTTNSIKLMEEASDNATGFLSQVAQAGLVAIDKATGRVATPEQYQRASISAAAGAGMQDPRAWAKEVARTLDIQFQAADIMGQYAQTTTIPYQFATGRVQSPFVDPAAGISMRNASPEARAAAEASLQRTRGRQTEMGIISRNAETGRFEFGEGSFAAQGMDAMRQSIVDEFGTLDEQIANIQRNNPATSYDPLTGQMRQSAMSYDAASAQAPSTIFEESMQAAMGLSVEMARLTTRMQEAQKEVQDVSIANQFRLANRALADARGLVGDIGGSRLGYLQREQYLTGRASQALGLNAQKLSLASQQIGLAAQKLSLALQARQIATNLAVAQFQAPGETGEERYARQREAIIRAGIEKKQLGYSQQQFGISQQQFGISEQQLGFATKQFQLAGQIWAVNARRAATDAEKSLIILQVSKDAAIKQQAAQQAYAAAAAKQGLHLQRAAEVARRAENRKNQYTSALASGVTAVADSFLNLAIGLNRALEALRNGPPSTEKGGGGQQGDGTVVEGATGLLGTTAGPTNMLVGEAGRETVAVLRNPRTSMLAPSGGGGGSTINISISDVKVRSSEDIEQLATMVANKVERRLGRKGQMLGLRQPSY